MKIGEQRFIYRIKALVSKLSATDWSVEFCGNSQTILVQETGKKQQPREAHRGPYDPILAYIAESTVNECDPK